jgi:hypothetical protein
MGLCYSCCCCCRGGNSSEISSKFWLILLYRKHDLPLLFLFSNPLLLVTRGGGLAYRNLTKISTGPEDSEGQTSGTRHSCFSAKKADVANVRPEIEMCNEYVLDQMLRTELVMS